MRYIGVMDKRHMTSHVTSHATLIALTGAVLLLVGWAGLIGWWRYGPDMILALAAGSLSLCF